MDLVETVYFDLIFVDYFLPGQNGSFALEFLEQVELNRLCPVLLVTSATTFPDDIDIMNPRLKGVLIKAGLNESQVAKQVNKALEQANGGLGGQGLVLDLLRNHKLGTSH
ncbi:hypothetical protein [Algirhabdus cladophorae]|uniref:hypothetical protein n=1 Tax=Algirhabdus cladophorae TaxID=3377108 RepID=UPI003B848ABD